MKGNNKPLEYIFEKIHPENIIINNYIKNFNKWSNIENEKI